MSLVHVHVHVPPSPYTVTMATDHNAEGVRTLSRQYPPFLGHALMFTQFLKWSW